ncbi:MAG: hypothetical protein H6765_05460 [Candidatus Peribacteria bacterium]|nr:MAG: hypothetical protein H6765_05460 [Candidatus Peribacteria bacterium]
MPLIKSLVEKAGMEAFVFEIGGEPTDIFQRDYNNLATSDLIIAEVSERSHGVGIEIGMSYCLGLKRILLLQTDEYVTKLAQGMPDTTIISYTDEQELIEKLGPILRALERKQ